MCDFNYRQDLQTQKKTGKQLKFQQIQVSRKLKNSQNSSTERCIY